MTKILIIEDEKELLENISEIFAEDGYEVLKSSSGEEGVELARKYLPDIILCDILMPGIDGYEVKNLVSEDEKTASIPFVFLTAKSSSDEILAGLKLGADDYIVKPFKAVELLSTVKKRLSRINILRAAEDLKDDQKILSSEGRILLRINNNPTFITIDSIVLISSDDYYSIVHLNDGRNAMLKKSLKSWQTILPEQKFLRVHRSLIINMDYIEKMEKWSKSTYIARLKNYPEPIHFSHRYSRLIREKMLIR